MLKEATVYTMGDAQWAFNGSWRDEDMPIIDELMRQHVSPIHPSFWSLASLDVASDQKAFSALDEDSGAFIMGGVGVDSFAEKLERFFSREPSKAMYRYLISIGIGFYPAEAQLTHNDKLSSEELEAKVREAAYRVDTRREEFEDQYDYYDAVIDEMRHDGFSRTSYVIEAELHMPGVGLYN